MSRGVCSSGADCSISDIEATSSLEYSADAVQVRDGGLILGLPFASAST